MSAQFNAAGLFSQSEDQKWNDSLNWQPVPIHTVPSWHDYLLGSTPPCVKAYELCVQYLFSNETKQLFVKFSEFRKWLEKKSGTKVHSIIDFAIFYDSLNVENLRGLS